MILNGTITAPRLLGSDDFAAFRAVTRAPKQAYTEKRWVHACSVTQPVGEPPTASIIIATILLRSLRLSALQTDAKGAKTVDEGWRRVCSSSPPNLGPPR